MDLNKLSYFIDYIFCLMFYLSVFFYNNKFSIYDLFFVYVVKCDIFYDNIKILVKYYWT